PSSPAAKNGVPLSFCAVAMRGSARSISAKINDLRRVMREGLISIIAYCPLSFFDFSIDDVAPVHFEYDREAAHGVRIAGDQADFASLIQFDFAQALASEEDFTAVTDDRLGVQANDGHVADFDVQRRPAHRSDDLDLDSRAGPVFEQFDHPRIGELAVVNQQLFFGARNEFGELSPRIERADYKMLGLHPVGLAIDVRFEQTHRLGDEIGLLGDHSETAAMVD